MIAGPGTTVSVEYTGTLEDGTIFDSSSGREPLQFKVGAHQVIKGFEEGVEGMSIGEEKKITIKPAEAYGEHNPAMVIEVPKESIAQNQDIAPGIEFMTQAPNGQQIRGTVAAVEEDTVTLDFNHPLAGKTLIFDVKLVKVE